MCSDLDRFCVSVDGTLFDALKVIDRASEGFAVVLDDDQLVYGTLTDGDIRRVLLAGKSINLPLRGYVHTSYIFVGPEEGREYVLDLMQARRLRQVPIIDKFGKLLGVHLQNQLLGNIERPNWAVIMVGGKGSRLYPLTENIPKPMVKVAGRPVLERLVLHLVSHGIQRIFLSVNYLSDVIVNYFGDGRKFGCRIEYLREREPLGTAGSLALLLEESPGPVFILNGDLVMNADLGAMLDFHNQGAFHATLGIKTYYHRVPYGCVVVENDCVVAVEEKPALVRQVNAGIYILSSLAVKSIPLEFYSIIDFLEESLQGGFKLGAYDLDGDWIDVGTPEQLERAQGVQKLT